MGSGVGVLDVDRLSALDELEEKHGVLPAGPQVRTGGGGLHIYFNIGEEEITNRQDFVDGLDWRGDGGYVVAPGSTHASGSQYEPIDFDKPLPELPDWLLELLRKPKDVIDSKWDWREYLREAPPCVSGEDGQGTILRVMRRVCSGGLVTDWNTVKEHLEAYNERCEPPWDDLERQWGNTVRWVRERALVPVPRDKFGFPLQSYRWLLKIMKEDVLTKGKIRKNLMGNVPEFEGEAVTDDDEIRIAGMLLEKYGWNDLSPSKVHRAMHEIMGEEAYSPVVDYLSELKWDGKKRLNKVAAKVLGADTELAAEQVARWMVGACARARVPGIRFDFALVLKGDQGRGKSTFFRTLGGDWYDETPVDLHNKDSMQSIGRCWLYSWDELATSWSRKDVNVAKNFITRTTDIYRPPFERNTVEVKRRCVFAATTNDDEILYDNTGSRRFWIVEATGVVPKPGGRKEFDLAWLAANRDQLWAEADARWLKDPSESQLGLPYELDLVREEYNQRFEPEDVVYEKTLQRIDDMRREAGYPGFVLLSTMQEGLRERHERASVKRALHTAGFTAGAVRRVAGRSTKVWLDTKHLDASTP